MRRMNVAVVGSGISGLTAAYTLSSQARVTLYEAGDYFGGHTHTVDVTLADRTGKTVTHGVDTGFLVFNDRTYPNLIRLFDELKLDIADSDMSFSVQVPGAFGSEALEWSGSDLNTVFAQRGNLLRPKFWGMLADLLRFNKQCTALALNGDSPDMALPLGEFLSRERYGDAFVRWYLLPMLGCIWSCPTDQMLLFPVATMVRFCHNHGLIQVTNRPQWRTVAGGARNYVQRMLAQVPDARLRTPVQRIERDAAVNGNGVRVFTEGKAEVFDAVVLATHSDQALAMLAEPSQVEQAVLGAIRYQPNRAVLHTDASVMPKRRKAWAAWNYERAADAGQEHARVCLHYWLNQLQPLPFAQDVIVSLNPLREIPKQHVMGDYEYAHPVFDRAAIAAQAQAEALQGQTHTYYCGAWLHYGFHEDGHRSGLAAARALLKRIHEVA
jgi:uncharacterized protein